MKLIPSGMTTWLLGAAEPDRRQTLVAFNMNVGLRMVFDIICGAGSIIMTAYALSLGVDKKDMGYLPAAMYLAGAMQLACLFILPKLQDRKRFVILGGAIEPLLIIGLVALMPLMPDGLRLPYFVVVILLAVGTMQLTRPIIDNWIAEAIPDRIRPKYLALRAQVTAVAQIVAIMVFASLADLLGKSDPVMMAGLIVFGCGCGVLAVLSLQGAAMPNSKSEDYPSMADLVQVMSHKPYVRVLIVTLGFNFPFYFAAPYYQTFNLDVLKMSASTAAALTAVYGISKFLSLFVSHKLIKYLGSRNLLLLSTPLYTVFFFIFLFCGPDRYWPLFLAWLVIGVCDGAYNVVIFTELYKSIPKEGPRTMYFVVYSIMSLVIYGVIASMVPQFLSLLETGVPWLIHQFGGTLTVTSDGTLYLLYGMAAVLMLPCGLAGLALPRK